MLVVLHERARISGGPFRVLNDGHDGGGGVRRNQSRLRPNRSLCPDRHNIRPHNKVGERSRLAEHSKPAAVCSNRNSCGGGGDDGDSDDDAN